VYAGRDLVSIDLFNRCDVYAEYFPKLLRGIGLELILRKRDGGGIPEAEGKFRVLDLLDKAEEAEADLFPGVGVGSERRFKTEGFSGFELTYNSHRIHSAILKSAGRRESA